MVSNPLLETAVRVPSIDGELSSIVSKRLVSNESNLAALLLPNSPVLVSQLLQILPLFLLSLFLLVPLSPGVQVTVHRAAGALSGFDGDRIGIGMWEGGKNDRTTNPQPVRYT